MAYQSKYQDQIDGLMGEINNSQFAYDPLKDAAYQQYQKDYTRFGRQAMEDTYGMVANRTGGLGSSYATTAANQQYNKYMQDLAAKIPELRNLAYGMYKDDLGQKQAQLNNYLTLDNRDYDRWQYDDQMKQAAAAAAARGATSGGAYSGITPGAFDNTSGIRNSKGYIPTVTPNVRGKVSSPTSTAARLAKANDKTMYALDGDTTGIAAGTRSSNGEAVATIQNMINSGASNADVNKALKTALDQGYINHDAFIALKKSK